MNGEELLAGMVETPPEAEAPPEEFPFTTLPPEVSFLTRGVQPPGALYLQRGDRLLLWMWNSVPALTLTVTLRLLLPNGELKQSEWTYTPNSNRALEYYFFNLAEGFILGFSAIVAGPAPAGAFYLRAAVMAGGGPYGSIAQVLVSGYVVRGSALCWPYPRHVGPVEGPGRLRVIVGTDPAPGFEISETVPAGARWRLLGLQAVLTTSAAAANRYVTLRVDDGTSLWYWSSALFAQTAGFIGNYSWAIGVDARAGLPAGLVQDALPDRITLAAGWRFRTETIGRDAGDNWGAPVYYVEEWVEP